jgi:NADH:ubiquinone oxidoreductase subunit
MGHERRWVIYNGVTEPSRVPPSWRSWLTYTHDVPPSEEHYVPRAWEKEPLANMTGTPYAYRPQGSTNASGERPPATGDYVPWTPAGWSGEHDVVQPNAHPGTHGVGLKQPQAG